MEEQIGSQCQHCNKIFTKKKSLYRHVRNVHKVAPNIPGKILCPITNCHRPFPMYSKLRKHLILLHKITTEMEEFEFKNKTDFLHWKDSIEKKGKSFYSSCRSYNLHDGSKKSYFSCNRSGSYNSKSSGFRAPRTYGSCKTGYNCPSTIEVLENKGKGLNVVYYKTHIHLTKLKPFLKQSEKDDLSNVDEVPSYKDVLSEIHDSYSGKDHFQYHILQKKDIQRIKKTLTSESQNLHMVDAESLDLWVKSCFQMENSPVLHYQPANCSDNSPDNDFALIIMTEYQKYILLASAKEVVCVDRLHRKMESHYYVTILSVMDEYNLAFPVAFCVSSKVDKLMMLQFFNAIKQTTGDLDTGYFMSDGDEFFYEAWKEIMSSDAKWLWSTWYVDSYWRGKLRRTFKGDIEKRSEVFKSIRTLMECPNESIFTSMLQVVIKTLNDNIESKALGNYLEQHYASNAHRWAQCHRRDLAVDTSIHLEVLHRTLLFCTRNGFKRLDKYIFILMKLVRDKIFDRLSKLESSKLNLALANIDWCHKAGIEIPVENVIALTSHEWDVNSLDSSEKFRISLCNESCPEHCSLKCEECNICVHMFTCTCCGNLINANLCEHIHAVAFNYLTNNTVSYSNKGSIEDINTSCIDDATVLDVDDSAVVDDNFIAESDICDDQANINDFKSTGILLHRALKRVNRLYKKIKSNKCNLTYCTLQKIILNLNKCLNNCENQSPLPSEEDSSEFDNFIVNSRSVNGISGVNSIPIARCNVNQMTNTCVPHVDSKSNFSKNTSADVQTNVLSELGMSTIFTLDNSNINSGMFIPINPSSNTLKTVKAVDGVCLSANMNTIFSLATAGTIDNTDMTPNKLANTVFAILTQSSTSTDEKAFDRTDTVSNALNTKVLTSVGSCGTSRTVSGNGTHRTTSSAHKTSTELNSSKDLLPNIKTHSKYPIGARPLKGNKYFPIKATARKSFSTGKVTTIVRH